MVLPFVDSIRDFVWEVIFSYVRGINPVFIRSKLLFDVLDKDTRTGWSCKTLKLNRRDISPGSYEFVIQRADVITKAHALGYPGLSMEDLNDNPQRLGNAVLTHWNNKINGDAETQGVTDRRFVLLLKSNTDPVKPSNRGRTKTSSPDKISDSEVQFVCFEGEIKQYGLDEIIWERRMRLPKPSTVATRKKTKSVDEETEAEEQVKEGRGLVGRRKNAEGKAGEEVYIWYSNQKQLFEKFVLIEGSFNVVRFIAPKRLQIAETVELLRQALDTYPGTVGSSQPAQT